MSSLRKDPRFLIFLISCLIFLLLSGSNVFAHDLGLTRLLITQDSSNSLMLEAKIPQKLQPSTPEVNNDCSVKPISQIDLSRLNKLVTWQIQCSDALPTIITIDWDRAAALIKASNLSGQSIEKLVDAEGGRIEIKLADYLAENAGVFSVVGQYVKLGVEHILIGLDHLAFVLGLFLLATGWKLVKLVTAFTVGHSISLAAASQGLLDIPVLPTEAVIALSVAYIYREALLPSAKRHQSLLLVVLFGLLHGLGFASVLTDLGVSSNNVLLSILSFNVGVEIGQLLFIGFLFAITLTLSRFQFVRPAIARQFVILSVGSVAVFWTIERVFVLI